jgi:hypothetical protein
MRYELRKLPKGWAVWDKSTNAPATFGGFWQSGLTLGEADYLVDHLNEQARQKEAESSGRDTKHP